MIKNILGTAGTKIIAALVSLIILTINAKLLGAEGVGTIALLILGITIILLVSSLAGGASLVYLTPRKKVSSLYLPSFIWAFLSALMLAPLFEKLNWIPEQLTPHLLALSIIRGINANHTTILLGKEKIKTNNGIALIEIFVLLITLLFFYFITGEKVVKSYVIALYFSYSFTLFLSGLALRKYLKFSKEDVTGMVASFKAIARYSFFIQTGNFFQLLNYRLSYYFIEYFIGRAALGIFSVGNRISESLWLISKSMSTVQYARISNSEDINYSIDITLKLFRFTLAITVLLTLIVLLIPSQVYVFVFGAEFITIKTVLCGLAIGIVSLACSITLSSFLSGIGKQHLNTIGSLLGLLFTITLGLILIPTYKIMGAAVTASTSYFVTNLFYLISFMRISKVKVSQFLPQLSDFSLIKSYLKQLKTNRKNTP